MKKLDWYAFHQNLPLLVELCTLSPQFSEQIGTTVQIAAIKKDLEKKEKE